MALKVDFDKETVISPKYDNYLLAKILELRPEFKNLNTTDTRILKQYFQQYNRAFTEYERNISNDKELNLKYPHPDLLFSLLHAQSFVDSLNLMTDYSLEKSTVTFQPGDLPDTAVVAYDFLQRGRQFYMKNYSYMLK